MKALLQFLHFIYFNTLNSNKNAYEYTIICLRTDLGVLTYEVDIAKNDIFQNTDIMKRKSDMLLKKKTMVKFVVNLVK